MKAEKFIEAIEAYYGQYANGFQRRMVLEYSATIPEAEREAVFRIICESVDTAYKSVPDIAAIKKIRDKFPDEIKRLSGQVWEDSDGRVFAGAVWIGRLDGRAFYPWLSILTDEQRIGLHADWPHTPEQYVAYLRTVGALEAPKKKLEIEDETKPR